MTVVCDEDFIAVHGGIDEIGQLSFCFLKTDLLHGKSPFRL
jgi:hypothetical protein